MACNRHALIIVDARSVDEANKIAHEMVPAMKGDAFTVGLVPKGSKIGTVPTDYWVAWPCDDEVWDALRKNFYALSVGGSAIVYDMTMMVPDDALVAWGLERARMFDPKDPSTWPKG